MGLEGLKMRGLGFIRVKDGGFRVYKIKMRGLGFLRITDEGFGV